MKKVNTLIIGAGVSGLVYASNSKSDYLIVEKESEPGGLCRTIYKDGFIWDYAGHFFHFKNSKIKSIFEEYMQDNDIIRCKKNTNINYYGRNISYPFQAYIHQLPKNEFIECLYDLFHKHEKNKYHNFEDMLYGKFGKSITEKFLKPYNEKLYACDLNELDVDAMGRFFPYIHPMDVIDNLKESNIKTYNSEFDYPRKGAMYFINILVNMINQDCLLLDSKVESIDPDKKVAVVNNELYSYERLINTMPLKSFVKMLPSDYSSIMESELSGNKVLVFNIGFDKEGIDKSVHWTYFPDKAINFYRVGYYSNILGSDRLSIYVEIGFQEHDEINVGEEFELTFVNLKKCGIISDHKVVSHNTLIIDPGYVHITANSNAAVKRLRDKLADRSIYTIGRYGQWTYCSIEDCMVQAMSLVDLLEKSE